MPATITSAPPFDLPAPPPAAAAEFVTFLPDLETGDPLARHWLRQATLRLRREICWLWHAVGRSGPAPADDPARLPPWRDRLVTVLDLTRYTREKAAFFVEDDTAAYLSARLHEAAPAPTAPPRGSFAWVAARLALDEVDAFVLALALLPVIDSAAGTVLGAALNDPARMFPTLALAQRLWDRPEEVLALADPAHPLWRSGLLTRAAPGAALDWDAPLTVPAMLASTLLFPTVAPPGILRPVYADVDAAELPGTDLVIARLLAAPAESPRLQPVLGPPGAGLADAAAVVARTGGRILLGPAPGVAVPLPWLCTLAWLCGVDLYVEWPAAGDAETLAALPALPVAIFIGLPDRGALKQLPARNLLSPLCVPPLSFAERRDLWRRALGPAYTGSLAPAVEECARRFRFERAAVLAAGRSLAALGRVVTSADLLAACRGAAGIDISDVAQPVTPRFEVQDLMLPPKQSRQIHEIIAAMQALTAVHFDWGTARAWNECGLSALFAGPPGTGKTMAAEVIAGRLDLPLYRIDLSQVVNKYIGETEKNLRRLFDAAESSDVVLFFDEADALFGRRTEVKDAHDRYANLEVSYLLERMERFKGLAILATNRKKDLDEAFLRRLRYLVEFPLPGPEERLRIWRRLLPTGVDCTGLDLPFLAQKLPLAGGHLRSIVFNACLQSARTGAPPTLSMAAVLAAAKREYDKLERPLNRDQLGAHAAAVERLDLAP